MKRPACLTLLLLWTAALPLPAAQAAQLAAETILANLPVDAEGNKLWDASFGGGSEYLLELQQASDGGFILGGQTGASDPTNAAYLEHVKDEIRAWGLEQRVLWTDFLPAEQVSAHFYASDVCVLPYRDGASFRRGSFMAALAHGIPIVTTHPQASAAAPLTAQDERFEFSDDLNLPALTDGDNVLLVSPDDPDAIVLAVTRVQTSPGLAALLSGSARLTARAFSWDKIADEHVELYEKMVR